LRKSSKNIWLIVISAFVITLLANIELFNRFYTLSNLKNPTPFNLEDYRFTIQIGFIGVVTELLMLFVFAFFNYSWKNKLFNNNPISYTFLGNLIIIIAFIGIDMYIFRFVVKTNPNLVLSWQYLKDYFINHSLVLTIAIVAPYMLLRMENAREMELNLLQIKEEKSIAELSALKVQISPHFFFNTLSTLSSIVRSDTQKASLEFINDISKTYRYALSSSKRDTVSLKEEIKFITAYADILQKRFGKKLVINQTISKEIYSSNIPPMSIQLLIENAVQHNVMTAEKPLQIDIYDQENYIYVENNLQDEKEVDSFGIGLMNLKNRYKLIADQEIYIEKKSNRFLVKLPILL